MVKLMRRGSVLAVVHGHDHLHIPHLLSANQHRLRRPILQLNPDFRTALCGLLPQRRRHHLECKHCR